MMSSYIYLIDQLIAWKVRRARGAAKRSYFPAVFKKKLDAYI